MLLGDRVLPQMATLVAAADRILDECDTGTSRDQIVWAVGVKLCQSAYHFEQLLMWRPSDKRMWSCAGRLATRGFDSDRKGIHLYAGPTGSPDVVPVIGYGEIAELATVDRMGADLHRQIHALREEERSHTVLPRPAGLRDWEDTLVDSQALAAQIWERCRPDGRGRLRWVQPSIDELLAAFVQEVLGDEPTDAEGGDCDG